MITKKQRTAYRKSIGKYYTARIRAYLERENILSKHGKPYADSTIWLCFNGKYESKVLEKVFEEVENEIKNPHLKTSVETV